MSTKTDTSNQYNQGAMGTYNAFQPQLMNQLMQMVNNPLGSSFFQNQLAQAQGQSRQLGQRSNSNLLRNMRTGGGVLSNSAGFAAGALGRNQIGNNMMQGNAFNSTLNTALQNRNFGLSSMQAYQPLQTGQSQTKSGLGTWLPQLAGAAIGGLTGGGLSSLFGGGGAQPPNPMSGTMAPQLGGLNMGPPPPDLNPYNMPGLGNGSNTVTYQQPWA